MTSDSFFIYYTVLTPKSAPLSGLSFPRFSCIILLLISSRSWMDNFLSFPSTVCPDGKYFHQNKLFFIFTLIIFSEHSYFLRKSQITPEWKQRKKYFLTPFALHRNIQTARKAFIYGLFRNLVRYSNSTPFSVTWCKIGSVQTSDLLLFSIFSYPASRFRTF